jgi:hypothetical protein
VARPRAKLRRQWQKTLTQADLKSSLNHFYIFWALIGLRAINSPFVEQMLCVSGKKRHYFTPAKPLQIKDCE